MAKPTTPSNNQIEKPTNTLSRSVTKDDISKYVGHGIINLMIPAFAQGTYEIYGLPPELPPTAATAPWSKTRDLILAATPKAEGIWANVIDIVIAQLVARGTKIEGPVARRIDNVNQMLEWCDGYQGFETLLERSVQAYLTSSSIGAAFEIVRTSRSPGAKIITINSLDPLRCWRTGDPNTPLIYWDLHGIYHELKSWECFTICDMYSPRGGWWWGGQCASERAYRDIRAVAAMTQYFDEKITGSGYNSLVFIPGINTADQIKEAKDAATAEQLSKGIVYYQGKLLIPFFGDKDSLDKVVEVKLKGMPDDWDREKELELRQMNYAIAAGIPFNLINPRLSARGALGVGAQSQIIDDAARGALPAKFSKEFCLKVNRLVTPKATSFSFQDNDLRDDEQKAKVRLTRAQARAASVASGELTTEQALYLAIQDGDAPREFMNATTPVDETLTDQDKPMDESDQAALETASAAHSAQQSAPDEQQVEPIQTKEVKDAPNLRHSDNPFQQCDKCKHARNINSLWYCRPYDFPTKDDWVCDSWSAPDGSAPDEPPATVKEYHGHFVSVDGKAPIEISLVSKERKPLMRGLIASQIEQARELYRKARAEGK